MTYTPEDGFKLLAYLGFQLDPKEQRIFREKFTRLYDINSRYDLIGTCWEIYSGILPFAVAREIGTPAAERNALETHQYRDSEFAAAIERTGIEEKLRQIITLDEIIGGEK